MSTLTITHTPAEGTMLDGTSRGDGVNVILRAAPMQWKWSRNLGQFYVQRSRDRVVPNHPGINATAAALRDAGHEVSIEIGTETRPVEEREQTLAENTDRRVDMLEDRAERRTAESDAAYKRSKQLVENIPVGQPILVGHHSERRHRNTLDKSWNALGKSVETGRAAEHAARGAEAAEASQAHRVSGPATMRRIEKLEADERRMQRKLDGYERHANIGGQRVCLERHQPASGEYRTRIEAILADTQEQLRYWRKHLDEIGHKVWTKADFAKGDGVRHDRVLSRVLRVNAKSVTVPHLEPRLAAAGYTWKVPYDRITGHVPAGDMPTEEEVAAQ